MSSFVFAPGPPAGAGDVVTTRWRIERAGRAVLAASASLRSIAPDAWPTKLLGALTRFGPGVGAVGAKRVGRDGRIVAVGDFVIHPKGYHQLGQDLPADAVRFAEDVDAFSGGAIAFDAEAFDACGGAELLDTPLGAIELCLRLRLRGRRVLALPDVVAVDDAAPTRDDAERDAFALRWGFDWRAADLDVVRRRYAGTGLLWNVRLHGDHDGLAADVGSTPRWSAYDADDAFRRRMDHLVKLVRQSAGRGPVLDVACGDGLAAHLLACGGVPAHGLDRRSEAIESALERTGAATYPGPAPTFACWDGGPLPSAPGAFGAVALLDVLQRSGNPVALLREAERVLAPRGSLVVSTPAWQHGRSSDPAGHAFEFTMDELIELIESATSLRCGERGIVGGVSRDVVVCAFRGS